MRTLKTRAGTILAAIALISATGPTATADFDPPEAITSPAIHSEASLVIDGDGKDHLAYIEYGRDPGILLAIGTNGTWASPDRVSSGEDHGLSLVLDGTGKHHVVFTRGGPTSDQGIWYATDTTGSWALTRLSTDPAGSPSMAIDPSGHLHVVYASYSFSPGLYQVTNETGSWVRTRIAAGHLFSRPVIAVSSTGVLRVAVASRAPETRGIWLYSKTGVAAWTSFRVSSTWDEFPSIALDAGDKIHLAFRRYASGARGLLYANNVTGSWVTQTVVPLSGESWVSIPTIRVKPGGGPEIAVGYWIGGDSLDSGIYLWSTPGVWSGQRIAGGAGSQDVTVFDLEYGSEGPRIAVTEWDPTPGLYLATTQLLTPYQQVDESTWDDSVALALDADGHRHVAIERTSGDLTGAADSVQVGTDATGSWAFATAGDAHYVPDMALDSNGKHHAAFKAGGSITYATDKTGSWASETVDTGAASDPSIALDSAGHPFLSYVKSNVIQVARNTTGTWSIEAAASPATSGRPSIGIDGLGTVYVAYEGGGGVWIVTNHGGGWNGFQLASGANGPSLAVFNELELMIAFNRTGSSAGTWLTDYKIGFGLLNTIRLTRSSAETPPSVAVDASAHSYVAFGRYSWAANPGLYLVSNRTGPWVTTQVSKDLDVLDVSLAIDDSNHAVFAYTQDGIGITLVVQVDPLGTTIVRKSSASSFAPSRAEDPSGRGREQPAATNGGSVSAGSGSANVTGGPPR